MPRFEFSIQDTEDFTIRGPIEKFVTTPIHTWTKTERIKKMYVNGALWGGWTDPTSSCIVYMTLFILRRGQVVPLSRKQIGRKRTLAKTSFIIPPFPTNIEDEEEEKTSLLPEPLWRGVSIESVFSGKKSNRGSMPFGKYKRGRVRRYYQVERGDTLYLAITLIKNPTTLSEKESYRQVRSYLLKRSRNMHQNILDNMYYQGSTGMMIDKDKMNTVDPDAEKLLGTLMSDTSVVTCRLGMSITRTTLRD